MTQPTRMPRTQLEFKTDVESPLVPERGEDYYSTPNPNRDRSGAFEAVRDAGPAPFAKAMPAKTFSSGSLASSERSLPSSASRTSSARSTTPVPREKASTSPK